MWSRSRCNYCVYIIYHHMISWYVNGMYHSCTVISVMVYLGESIFPQLPGTDLTLRLPGVRKPPMPMRQLRQPPKARCVAICCDLVVIPRVILLGKKCCGPYFTILYHTSVLFRSACFRRRGRPSSRRRRSRRHQSRRLPCACRPRRKLVLTRREGWIQNGFPMLPGLLRQSSQMILVLDDLLRQSSQAQPRFLRPISQTWIVNW